MIPQKLQYRFGDFLLDIENGLLLKNQQLVPLTWRAFKVLELLVKNEGRVVQKKDFMEIVWKDSFVEEGNLPVAINSIRKVLHKDGNKFIETFSRRGYRFSATVEKIVVYNDSLQNQINIDSPNNYRQPVKTQEQRFETSNTNDLVQPNTFVKICNFFVNLNRTKTRTNC